MENVERVSGTQFTINFAVGTRDEEEVTEAIERLTTAISNEMSRVFFGLYDYDYTVGDKRKDVELLYNNGDNDDFSFIGIEETN